MKLITSLIAVCFIINNSIAADTTIFFRQINYSELFKLAKQERKSVFLYFHTDGCGGCVKMEQTAFVDKNVVDFYNENFICLEVNTRQEKGIEINKIYNVKMHPTFLYLDENANILHKIVGVYSPNDFLSQAKNALSPEKALTAFKKQYREGKRDANFLFEYCYKLRDAKELDSQRINEYLNTQSYKELKQVKNLKFIYEFVLHNFKVTVPFDSKVFQFLLKERALFDSHFDADQVDTRIVWVLNSTVQEAAYNKDKVLFDKVINVLKDFDNGKMYVFKEMDGRTTGMISGKNLVLSSEILYYKLSNDTQKYQEAMNRYIKEIWNDSEELNAMAWYYYENYNDKKYLELAKGWVIRSIELNSNYANNDTYASILYKLGDYKLALQQAKLAISVAKNNNKDYQETTKLIEKIKEKIK